MGAAYKNGKESHSLCESPLYIWSFDNNIKKVTEIVFHSPCLGKCNLLHVDKIQLEKKNRKGKDTRAVKTNFDTVLSFAKCSRKNILSTFPCFFEEISS